MKHISYSDEGEVSVQPEINKKKTGLRWRAVRPSKLKFVDDGMILTNINMDSATVRTCPAGGQAKTKHDLQSQNLFRRIVGREESRGRERVEENDILTFACSIVTRYIPHVRDFNMPMRTILTRPGWTADGGPARSRHVQAGPSMMNPPDNSLQKSRCMFYHDTPIFRMESGILPDPSIASSPSGESWPSRISGFLRGIIGFRFGFLNLDFFSL